MRRRLQTAGPGCLVGKRKKKLGWYRYVPRSPVTFRPSWLASVGEQPTSALPQSCNRPNCQSSADILLFCNLFCRVHSQIARIRHPGFGAFTGCLLGELRISGAYKAREWGNDVLFSDAAPSALRLMRGSMPCQQGLETVEAG